MLLFNHLLQILDLARKSTLHAVMTYFKLMT